MNFNGMKILLPHVCFYCVRVGRHGDSRLQYWRSLVLVCQSLWWEALGAHPLHMSADQMLCSNSQTSVFYACSCSSAKVFCMWSLSRLKFIVVDARVHSEIVYYRKISFKNIFIHMVLYENFLYEKKIVCKFLNLKIFRITVWIQRACIHNQFCMASGSNNPSAIVMVTGNLQKGQHQMYETL